MRITLPAFSLIALVGPSGAGKSSFAAKHFLPTEVLSSDRFRAWVSDDENDMDATNDAFDVLHYVASKRLAAKRLTVIDATNVQDEARKPIIQLARQFHCLPVAIVLNMPEKLCHERNKAREDRSFRPHVISTHVRQCRRTIKRLKKEGFRYIYVLHSPEEVDTVTIQRQRLWTDKEDEHGPFDIIGDIHGCFDELHQLLTKLDYNIQHKPSETGGTYQVTPPTGRKAIFLGDLVDRGPKTPEVLRLVMDMVEANQAICIPGNHDVKLVKKLRGKNVKLKHGLVESIEQLSHESDAFRERVIEFLDGLISHYVLDDGKLVVAHAGMIESYQGRASGRVRQFALYGETIGETDEFGLPIRYDWAAEYRGRAMVVYGHTPVPDTEWLNNTLCLDTGCVFGGKLSALRYPEREIVQVDAAQVYCEPIRPLPEERTALSAQQQHDDLLHIEDVQGKRLIETRWRRHLTIREENAAAALEVMSRFAVDPHWLIYLPPTMSPSETSSRDGYLEYPDKAFQYYRKRDVQQVICEEKHMGSRAVIVICRSVEAAKQRFGIEDETFGVCYTRTGRPFFKDASLERNFLERVQDVLTQTGFWEAFETDWCCLDTELMPWSAKAQVLLQQQYAPVGLAAASSFSHAAQHLQKAVERGLPLEEELSQIQQRHGLVESYQQAYRQYCWSVVSLEDYKLAPFHLMATEGHVHTDKPHTWHMELFETWAKECPQLFKSTKYKLVDVEDEESCRQGMAWWEEMTSRGGEGMVIKPLDFIVRHKKDIIQPAVKCRGQEYLRIIYGMEYTLPEHMKRLRKRGLSRKRSLAIREFCLGLEGLNRFVERQPLRKIHECVFGVLALESEGVDPRL